MSSTDVQRTRSRRPRGVTPSVTKFNHISDTVDDSGSDTKDDRGIFIVDFSKVMKKETAPCLMVVIYKTLQMLVCHHPEILQP
jgi:hypothetical protein